MPAVLRRDIQGLRALAVGLVVVFHITPHRLSGGYIGVDVFFVISGYLITSHLMRELDRTGTIGLRAFWARRIRRLLPASLVVLAVSVPLAVIFLPSPVLGQNLSAIMAAALYFLNWQLAANSVDYLAVDNPPSIAQHYWSLSVEEQFYLVWPILLILVAKIGGAYARSRPRRAALLALVLVFAASFAYSIFATVTRPAPAYFMTTTRAWEFAAGGIVSLLPQIKLRTTARHGLSWIALMVVVFCGATFSATTPFPGWIAILPVAATALLLSLGDSDSVWSPQYLTHAGPVQVVGDLSYSIYLWHWPIVVTFMAVENRHPKGGWIVAVAGLTVLLAWVTRRFVEDPIRFASGRLARPSTTFALTAAGMAVVLITALIPVGVISWRAAQYQDMVAREVANSRGCFGAYAMMNHCAAPYATTSSVNPQATAADGFNDTGPVSTDACSKEKVNEYLQVSCSLGSPEEPTLRVVMVGDSHVDQFAAPMQRVAQQKGWSLATHRRSGCSTFAIPRRDAPDQYCATFGNQLYSDLAADPQVDVVIIAIRADLYRMSTDRDAALKHLNQLLVAGKRVAVIRSVPGMPTKTSGPECVEQARGDDRCSWMPKKSSDWFTKAARSLELPILDTWSVMCANGTCHTVIGGTIAYFDSNHLATAFATTLAPWLSNELEQAIA